MPEIPEKTQAKLWASIDRRLDDIDPAVSEAAADQCIRLMPKPRPDPVRYAGPNPVAPKVTADDVAQRAAAGECSPEDARLILDCLRAAREVDQVGQGGGLGYPVQITVSTPPVDRAAHALTEAGLPEAYHRHRGGL